MNDQNEHPERVPTEKELREVVGGASATAAGVAQEMFAEAVIPAARYIIGVVDGSERAPDRARLAACQDVVTRVLGRSAGQQNAWDEFADKLTNKSRVSRDPD